MPGTQMFSDTTSVMEAVREGLLGRPEFEGVDMFDCMVCNKSMTGVVPAESHLKGKVHQKALANHQKRQQLIASVDRDRSDEPSPQATKLVQSVSVEEAMREGVIILQTLRNETQYLCTVCNITCNSDIPTAQHLEGEAHRKRIRRTGVVDEPAQRTPSPMLPSPTAYTANCTVDGISCKNIVDEAVDRGEVEISINKFECLVCPTTCNTNEQLSQHLQGKTHAKKRRNNAYKCKPVKRDNQPMLEEACAALPNPASPAHNAMPDLFMVNPSASLTPSPQVPDVFDCAINEGLIVKDGEGKMECLVCEELLSNHFFANQHLTSELHKRKYRDQINCQQSLMTTHKLHKEDSPQCPDSRPSPTPQPAPHLSLTKIPPTTSNTAIMTPSRFSPGRSPGYVESQPHPGRSRIHLPEIMKDIRIYMADDPLET